MRGNNAKPACISSCAQRVGVVLVRHVVMIINKNVLVCNASSQSKALVYCRRSLMNMHESNIFPYYPRLENNQRHTAAHVKKQLNIFCIHLSSETGC